MNQPKKHSVKKHIVKVKPVRTQEGPGDGGRVGGGCVPVQ